MHRIIAVIILIALGFLPSSLSAQKPRYQGLLWEITGNGLSSPSYLFGTMHTRDNRMFNLGDSVILAFDKSPALALELHLDSVVKDMFTMMFRKDPSGALSGEPLSLDELTKREPWLAEIKQNEDVPKKGDKAAFLDAFLFKMAKARGKKIIGIETLREQANAFSPDTGAAPGRPAQPASKSAAKKFITLLEQSYLAGDLDVLDSLMRNSSLSPQAYRKLITLRNITMSERIEGIIKAQPTFVAVGAGHLPGDSGVIVLLRKKGFQLRPVKSPNTGLSEKYIDQTGTLPWYVLNLQGEGTKVDLPAEPFLMPRDSSNAETMNMHLLFDVGSGITYYVLSSPTLPVSQAEADRIYESMIAAIREKDNSKLIKKTPVNSGNYRGVETLMRSGKTFYRTRMFIHDTRLSLLMATVNHDEKALYTGDAERFMTSLKVPAQQGSQSPTGYRLESREGAFTVELPSEPKNETVKVQMGEEKQVDLHVFSSYDAKSDIAYMVRYNDFYPGYVISNDTLYFSSTLDLFLQDKQRKLVSQSSSEVNGYPAREYKLHAPGNAEMRLKVVLRSSRVYVLIASSRASSSGNEGISRFFSSLAFTQYQPSAWQPFTSEEDDFTVKVPSAPVTETGSYDQNIGGFAMHGNKRSYSSYFSMDESSGISYVVTVEEFSEYYTAKNEEEVFTAAVNESLDFSDTIYSRTELRVGDLPAREVIIVSPGSHNVQQCRIILAGRKLYKVLAYIPMSEASSHKSFFDSFTITSYEGSVFENRKEKLFADLASGDGNVRSAAARAVQRFKFTADDLPEIYNALKKPYEDDGDSYGVRQSLLSHLALIEDRRTAPFIAELYPSLPAVPSLQLKALAILTEHGDAASIDQFSKLIAVSPPMPESAWELRSIFTPLYDSIRAAQPLFPGIMKLISHEVYREEVLTLANAARDSGAISGDALNPSRNEVLDIAREELKKRASMRSFDNGYYNSGSLMVAAARMLSWYPSPETYGLLNSMLADSSFDVKLAAAEALVRNSQKVNDKLLMQLAAHTEYRVELYKMLSRRSALHLFPGKYLSQKLMAESVIAVWFSYETESMPDKVEMMMRRTIEHNGRKVNVYLFKLGYMAEGKMQWYVGISGPQPEDEKQVSVSYELTGTRYESPGAKKASAHFDDLLNQVTNR